jgi:hypothetical protein
MYAQFISPTISLLTRPACRSICKVESDLASLSLSLFKLKNRHWWNSGEKYHRVEYCIKVAFGPADINFELWHEGLKLSKDNAISVEWHAAPAPDPRTATVKPDLPISLSQAMSPSTLNLSSSRSPPMQVPPMREQLRQSHPMHSAPLHSSPLHSPPLHSPPPQSPTRRPVPVEMPNSMIKTHPVTTTSYELA